MAWVRLDDRFIDHPKFLALSAVAFRLWVEGLTYCNKHLTDGLIAATALKGFRYVSATRVDELMAQHLWERSADGTITVHDYLDWNDDRDTVLLNREKAKSRAARARERAPHVLSGVDLSDPQESKRTEKERLDKLFEEFWAPYPLKVAKELARKAFNKRHPTAELVHAMLAGLAWQKTTDAWLKENGKYIPYPATWLNQGRWEDEPQSERRTRSRGDLAPASAFEWNCPHDPRCPHRSACAIVAMRTVPPNGDSAS